jgi:hypothetical protein
VAVEAFRPYQVVPVAYLVVQEACHPLVAVVAFQAVLGAFLVAVVASSVLHHSSYSPPMDYLGNPTISAQGLMVASIISRIIYR